MNWRRITHWYGTAPVAGLEAAALKAAGMAKRSTVTGALNLPSAILTSMIGRPFSSYQLVRHLDAVDGAPVRQDQVVGGVAPDVVVIERANAGGQARGRVEHDGEGLITRAIVHG